MRKKISVLLMIPALLLLIATGCNKDDAGPMGTLKLGITDTRGTQTTKTSGAIIDASKLTKFEITISKVELKTSSGGKIEALNQPVNVDLRNYQGSIKDLATNDIPLGNYSGVIIYLSGISVTYDGNTYTSMAGEAPLLQLADFPGLNLSSAQGVPTIFGSELGIDMTFDFEMTEELNNRNLNITVDVVAWCQEISFTYSATTQYFVTLRNNYPLNIYFEEGIQQIRHSPPLGVELVSGTTASYYGIHTFVDFNQIGGTINSHTSQHIYRGEDGSLEIEAEAMATNSSALTPNTINATGQTDVRADEVFDFATIANNLSEQSITLQAGKKYYFSLRKKWTITSGTTIYEITRTCEPIPVLWPVLVSK